MYKKFRIFIMCSVFASMFFGIVSSWIHSSAKINEYKIGDRKCMRVFLNANGSLVASPGEDRVIRIWNTETGELYRSINAPPHTAQISAVAFHPSKPWIVYGCKPELVEIWDYSADPVLVKSLTSKIRSFSQIDFMNNGDSILICGHKRTEIPPPENPLVRHMSIDSHLEKINILSEKKEFEHTLNNMFFRSATFSPSGKFLLVVASFAVWIFDSNTMTLVKRIDTEGSAEDAKFVKDDSHIVITQSTNLIYDNWLMYNMDTDQICDAMRFHRMSLHQIEMIPGTSRMWSDSDHKRLYLIDVENKKVLWKKATRMVWPQPSISADGKVCAARWDHGILILRFKDCDLPVVCRDL